MSLISGTALVTAWLVAALGLYFPPRDLARPLAVATVLACVALFYQYRKVPKFVLCCTALIHLILFSSVYSVLMYSISALGTPLVDEYLVAFDAMIGVYVPALKQTVDSYPRCAALLNLAYGTLLPQTALVVTLLGFCNRQSDLESFVLRFIVSALVTAALFCLLPAEGPFTAYGFAMRDDQVRYLNDLHAMRDGSRDVVTWRHAAGLITFPSFHTTWALLLALAVWRLRPAFLVLGPLNLAVILSTMSSGWHYSADVLGGIAICVLVVPLLRPCEAWLYSKANLESPPPSASCGAAGSAPQRRAARSEFHFRNN